MPTKNNDMILHGGPYNVDSTVGFIADRQNKVTGIGRPITKYSAKVMRHKAGLIAARIQASALKNNDGYSWGTYRPNDNNQPVSDLLSGALYDGTLGIACFLHQTDAIANSEWVNAIVARQVSKAYAQITDISYASGLAGLLYTLVKTHTAANNHLQTAVALTQLIKPGDFLKDDKFDLMTGSAGLLLSLAPIYIKTGSEDVLNLMTAIGDNLLNARVIDAPSGALTWFGQEFNRPLTGLLQGASGIGYSLLILFDITGKAEYKQAYYQSVKFENYYRNANRTNWCDLRQPGADCQTTWAHGAPGIGLARLRAYTILKDSSLLYDIETAIHTTKKHLLTNLDTYCCGNAGRIDFLLEASMVLNRTHLFRQARAALLDMMERRNTTGYYQTCGTDGINPEDPSLFCGTSGIGYVFLRSINPAKVPCLGLLC